MTTSNRSRGRPEISVQRICEACANRDARQDRRDQLCLICATLNDQQPAETRIRRPSRKET
jgi:hypothetical protein